jgi:transposase
MNTAARIDFTAEQAADLLCRVKANALQEGDCEIIEAMINTIIALKQSYEKGKIYIKRLLMMIFGSKTEKKKKVLRQKDAADHQNAADQSDDKQVDQTLPSDNQNDDQPIGQDVEENQAGDNPDKDTKGHGRNGADVFVGAQQEYVAHTTMKPGDPCTLCDGKVYEYKKPEIIIRFFGQAPVKAIIWNLERLRCNLCGAMFTPDLPEKAKGDKYDETAISMIALSRYGFGMPFNRLERLQACLLIPLAASTQWDKVELGADKIYPAFEHLKCEAAQGSVVHNDDTPMKILELMKENDSGQNPDNRKGMCTTGIVSIKDDLKIALFFTGRNHAGENIADILSRRQPQRPPPIQMCDALSRNFSQYTEVVLSHCNTHARRKFVDVADSFVDECSYVLEVFEQIYKNDAIAKKKQLSDHQRMQFHRENSGPVMEAFHLWLKSRIDEKQVEPNSGLGNAISYTLKHWTELTRFLNTPGAPVDNNLCEQTLKRAILHRRNSLFYKTAHGAYIGDMYMSLIHTCILNKINPFDYLTALQINSSEVFKNPGQWMPWNYKETISELSCLEQILAS